MHAGRKRIIAGCMTGTSLDGLDVVLAEVRGTGLEASAQALSSAHWALGDLSDALRRLASGGPARPIEYLRAARRLGELHAEAAGALCRASGIARPDLVAAHGQTIWHAPAEGLSWQLFDPWPLVTRLRTPVVHDLRQGDLCAGGQGAPITPLADWVLYRDPVK